MNVTLAHTSAARCACASRARTSSASAHRPHASTRGQRHGQQQQNLSPTSHPYARPTWTRASTTARWQSVHTPIGSSPPLSRTTSKRTKKEGGAVQSTLASARLKCSLQVHQPWLNHGSPITTLMRTTDMRFLRVGAVRPLHPTFVAPPLPAPRAGPPSLPHSPYAAVIERMGSCWSSSTQAATSHARLRPHEAVHMLSGGARGEKRSAGRLSPPLASSAQAATG